MTHPVTIRPEAQRDIEEAAFWYEGQRPGLGNQFIFQVDSLLQRIEERPLQFPDVGRGVRRGLLHRFPFAVYFVLSTARCTLIAVLHQHRHPDEWKRRA
jgi:plasmid stabilization system protein ParE